MNLKPYQISLMGILAKMLLTIFAKMLNVDTWQGSKRASEDILFISK